MLYDIAFFIFSLFYLPTLLFKGKLHGGFGERFARYSPEKRAALERARGVIWIQAVSVGEVALCRSLIPAIRRRYPDRAIVLSTITKTGNELAARLFSKDAVVVYFPLDFTFIVRKAVAAIRPAMYVMVETEIWPNLLNELSRRGIASMMINGRISDRSFGKYMVARPFIKGTLGRVGAFCMQSGPDAERIVMMGAPKDRVSVTGSMKFDIDIPAPDGPGGGMGGVLGLGPGDELFVAGSTHDGEEGAILGVYARLLPEFPALKLLVAPRHVERAGQVDEAVRAAGFDPVRMSRIGTMRAQPAPGRPVYILDSIGRMGEAFAASTIVFIGGSLVRHGGQNPIEPAVFGKPVLFGPHMFNFKNIARILLEGDAAIQVSGADDLFVRASALLKDRGRMAVLSGNARRAVADNRGATERNLEAMARAL